MARISTFSLPDDVWEKLVFVPNKSELIAILLRDHFKDHKSLSLEEIRRKKVQLQSGSMQENLNELKALEEIEEEILKTEQEKKEEDNQKEKRRLESFKDTIRLFCEIDETEVDGIAKMFNLERTNYPTFFDWCAAKGIKLKSMND